MELHSSPNTVLHYLENFVRMRLMGVSGPTEVQPLKEERAAELGADILGELFLYGTAAGYLTYEYYRSVKKEQDRDNTQDSDIDSLQESLKRVSSEVREMREKLLLLEQSVGAQIANTSTAKSNAIKSPKS